MEEFNNLKEAVEKKENVLQPKTGGNGKVANAVRINLPKPCFKDELLAACSVEAIQILDRNGFSFPNGYQKQWRCSVLALSEISDASDVENARKKAAEYNNGKIEDQYWDLARKSMGL